MAKRKSFVLYDDWGKMVVKLTDDQAGQLFKAICSKRLGVDYEIEIDAVDAIFSMLSDKMDEDAEEYENSCQRRSENIKKRWDTKESVTSESDTTSAKSKKNPSKEYKPIQNDTKVYKSIQTDTSGYKSIQTDSDNEYENDNENEYENDKEGESPLPPFAPTVAGLSVPDAASLGVPSELQEKVSEWVSNKATRNETLTEAEFKSFVSKVKANAKKYGASEVADLIEECMSNGYKGVTWDRLEKHARDKPENSYLYRIDHRLDVVDKWAEEVGAFEEETQ